MKKINTIVFHLVDGNSLGIEQESMITDLTTVEEFLESPIGKVINIQVNEEDYFTLYKDKIVFVEVIRSEKEDDDNVNKDK